MWRWSAIGAAWLLVACSGPELDPPDDAQHEPAPSADDHGRLAAGGIVIDRVTVDQAVAIDVYRDGEPLSPEQYRTSIVSGRSAYVRAMWSITEDWVPRPVQARIGVHHPDGSVDYAAKVLDIDGPANENWLEGAFAWYLPAEWLEEGVGFDFALYETDPDLAPELPPNAGVRAPVDGVLDVAVSPAPRELDVLIVPIEHTYDGGKDCGGAPEIDAMMREDFEKVLIAINPIERVNLSVRDEPYVFDQPATDFTVILNKLSALREEDGAPPWLYYYGLIDLCDWGSDAGYSGQARVPDEITPEYAWKRVAVGTVRASYGGIIGTFVHEMGHTQGRYHVPCEGETAIEYDYPYRDAMTASVGFDLVNWVLHPPTHRDYMSYCSPGWVGDYGWNRVLPTTEILTNWKLEGLSWNEDAKSLVGSIHPDGTEDWWVVRGQPNLDATEGAALRIRGADGVVEEVPARIKPHVLGESLEIVAPLPMPVEALAAIERVGIPGAATVDVEALQRASAR